MGERQNSDRRIRKGATRRQVLLGAGLPIGIAFAGKGQELPADKQRYLDAATEFEIVRLTKAEYDSILPPSTSRCLSRRGDWLLCTSNRFGSYQTVRLDLKSGAMRQVTELDGLQPDLLYLATNEKSFFCGNSKTIYQVATGSWREREIFQCPAGRRTGLRLMASDNGAWLALEELPEGVDPKAVVPAAGAATSPDMEVRLVPLGAGGEKQSRLVQVPGAPISMAFQPGAERLLAHSSKGLFLLEGRAPSQPRPLDTAEGRVLQAQWAPEGAAILYLLLKGEVPNLQSGAAKPEAKPDAKAAQAPAPYRSVELREFDLATGKDSFVAKTSQFAQFAPNGNATVFLGASASRGAPYLLILLRKVRRELPLCEHRSSDPRPTISANSQRVAFQTDRQGKMVLYMVAVEKLLERTGEEEEQGPEEKPKPSVR